MELFLKYLTAFGMSLVPVLELRGAIIYAHTQGLNPILSYIVCVIGNMLPVPFIILFIRPIFDWMKKKASWMRRLVERMEAKAHSKSEKIRKYEMLGLFLLVAIPLPGTGAWTGSLVAAMLGMRLKHASPMIFIGVLTAGLIVTLMFFGIFSYILQYFGFNIA